MQAVKLISTKDMTRSEWLQARRAGIGGSEAAAILGFSRWSSPVKVYMDKLGLLEDEDQAGEAAYWGTVLEDVVAQEFSKRTGKKVRRVNAILQHPEYPWMLANLDRMIVGEDEILECKTADKFLASEWKDDEIPISYLIQGQHYMAVTGYKAVWYAVLIGGNDFRYKRVERDEEVINHLIEHEKAFWQQHIEKQQPPSLDGSQATSDLLKRMYPNANRQEVALPSTAEELIVRRSEVAEQIKELQTQQDECDNKLKDLLGEAERGTIHDWTVIWANQSRTSLDTKRIKQEHPDLYKQYCKTSQFRKLTIKGA